MFVYSKSLSKLSKKMSTENKRVTRSMTKNTTPEPQVSSPTLYVYKDTKTGIEFLTKEQCDIQGVSQEMIYDSFGLYYVKKITSINNSYVKHLSDDIRLDRSLYALAPNGFVWEEGPRSTCLYSWDEPYVLVPSPKL